jgi:predicted O-linked N-acetylglucosamine transferase (SPINDLY family)
MDIFQALDYVHINETLNPERQFEADLAAVMTAAIEQHQQCNFDEAEALYQVVIDARPGHADANFNLGMLNAQRSQYDLAVPFFEVAIGTDPVQHVYWANYIDTLMRSGQVAAAKLVLEMAVAQGLNGPAIESLTNDLADATRMREGIGSPKGRSAPTPQEINQLYTLITSNRLSDVIALADKLTQQYPTFAMGWEFLGVAHVRLMNLPAGIPALRRTLELKPESIEVRRILADILRLSDRYLESEAECRRILAVNDAYPEAYRILGLAQRGLRRLDQAQINGRRAVELAPHSAIAHVSLGVTLMDQSLYDEAVSVFRHAIELSPTDQSSHENLLFCLSHTESLDREAFFEQHKYFARMCEQPLHALWKKHRNEADPGKRLRVGFVSGDFNQHPVSVFMEPVFRHLVKDESLTVHAYYTRTVSDPLTVKLREMVPNWHDIAGLSDDELADKIRADGIDVLIDLTGHTAYGRLLVFARKPAPIQASWMGYLGTTGMSAMDYYIADRHYVPEDQIEGQFVEKLAYLPAYAPFQTTDAGPEVNALPALKNGHITFGSFNRFNKLRPGTIALWAELLRALPDSRLMIAGTPRGDSYVMVRDWFEKEGIDASRIEFRQRATLTTYLAHHLDADIALDTFPYAGGVTTLQALWMGVPTLTLPGNQIASRGSTSILTLSGLPDFVASDRADFVAKGIAWAGKIEQLAQIRAGMRERCLQSPFYSEGTVTEAFSKGIRKMWQRWCAGEAPVTFDA